MASVYDGFLSRHLNRRISRPPANIPSRTPLTPSQVSVVSLGVALVASIDFFSGYPIVGGLLARVSSIVDGIDGDLARLKGMATAFGGFMDAFWTVTSIRLRTSLY